ncbi:MULTISPECIES: DUF6274 family protein [unclassified Streptomyces]|uniref:DUF6274 family protein n=1 Tax=unclassified Streptomyces TaxID=2593676 RepID=UPI0037F446C6
MTASTTGHRTSALLRAHLAAVSGHPHRTGYCQVCHRLQRLAMEYVPADGVVDLPGTPDDDQTPPDA